MKNRAVAVIITNNEVLLMRRIKNGEEYFCLPGGTMETGESPEDTVAREIKEELNLDIKIEKPLFQIQNQGREEFYFLVKEFSGTVELGGEEKERMTEANQYYPVWLKLSEMFALPNFYPALAKQKLNEIIQ